jgi:hypothetical protein
LTSTERASRATFALLVVACFAAFFVTQRLKHTPTVVQRFEMPSRFEPGSTGTHAEEGISFRLARSERATVTIENSSGDQVATLVRNRRLERYKQFSLRWSGHTGVARSHTISVAPDGHRYFIPRNPGPLAAAGEYRVRVYLPDSNRTVVSPRSFELIAR